MCRARIPRLTFTNREREAYAVVYDEEGRAIWRGAPPRAPLLIAMARCPRYLVHFLAPERAPRSAHVRLFGPVEGVWEARRHVVSVYAGSAREETLRGLPWGVARDVLEWVGV